MRPMTAPVTVAITRVLPNGHEPEMMSWLNAGINLAEKFPGFLGAGWVRTAEGSEEWHMLYRFADQASLEQWEHSPQRQWWRSSAAGLGVVEARVEKRTGIEGWFDVPQSTVLESGPSVAGRTPPPPPRWKQASTIFLVFFPLSVLANWVGREVAGDWPLVLRVLATVLVMTPLMTYVLLPWITRRLQWWLQGEPPPWRR
jgi:uncharacterized protein